MRALLGDLPGTAGNWTGWRFHDGELLDEAGNRYQPGEIRAIGLRKQALESNAREIQRLRTRIAVLEELTRTSANDAQVHQLARR